MFNRSKTFQTFLNCRYQFSRFVDGFFCREMFPIIQLYVLFRTENSLRSKICAPTVLSTEETWVRNTTHLDLFLCLKGI